MDVGRFSINSLLASDPPSFRRALLAWYRKNRRDLPWRHTRDPYAILVSEFMLQQTQVATVVPYYNRWLRRFPAFRDLAAAPQSDVLHAWQGLGYYARARNLHATAKAVMTLCGGVFPASVERIRQLPGLGRYTANAVATFAFDQSLPMVEANTARLLARLSNLQLRVDSGAGRDALWQLAAALVPKRHAGAYNSALMDLGALVCVSGQPRCSICPLRAFCRAAEPAELPIKKPRTPTKQLREHHAFTVHRGRVLLEQSRQRWCGLWILPRLPSALKEGALMHSAQFSFTHHRITLDVFGPSGRNGCTAPAQRWFSPKQIDSIPIPSPHRRALTALLARCASA